MKDWCKYITCRSLHDSEADKPTLIEVLLMARHIFNVARHMCHMARRICNMLCISLLQGCETQEKMLSSNDMVTAKSTSSSWSPSAVSNAVMFESRCHIRSVQTLLSSEVTV